MTVIGGKELTVNLRDVEEGKEYIISKIETNDEELDAFLFIRSLKKGEKSYILQGAQVLLDKKQV